jgi:hypothetical protein
LVKFLYLFVSPHRDRVEDESRRKDKQSLTSGTGEEFLGSRVEETGERFSSERRETVFVEADLFKFNQDQNMSLMKIDFRDYVFLMEVSKVAHRSSQTQQMNDVPGDTFFCKGGEVD